MARTKISEFSATPGNNTDIDGINIAEGCAPSGINDAIRELMSQLKDFQAGTAGDSFNGPVGTTTAAAGAFTTLSASSTVSGTGFSNYLASPPAIGGTAAAAGSFTTLSASSTLSVTGAGTIQGITVGRGAGAVSTNTAVGASALAANTSGGNNTVVGQGGAFNLTTGSDNSIFGQAAGYGFGGTNTASNNTIAGSHAGFRITSGNDNTLLGYYTGQSITTGASNVGVGSGALTSNTTASNNTAVGYQAGYTNSTGIVVTLLGAAAGYALTGNYNTGVGGQALYNTTGSNNVGVGNNALIANTSGSYNTGIGRDALQANTTASNNTAVGYQAGYSGTTGGYGVYLGYQAGYTSNATYGNLCIGYKAGYAATGGGNTLVGGLGSTGADAAGFALTTGTNNSFLGTSAGNAITTGAKNSILGSYNGNQGGLDIRTASGYIVLSDGDGNPRGYFNGSGNFRLGTTDAYMEIPLTSGNAFLGSITSTSAFQISFNSLTAGVQLASGGTSWGTFSDESIKDIIEPITDAAAKVSSLRAVIGKYKTDEDGVRRAFLIAQDVQAVLPEAVTTTQQSDGEEVLSLAYTETIPLLVAAIKELKAEVDSLKAQLKGA